MNATTGAPNWIFSAGNSARSPAVANGVLYFTTFFGDRFYALNAADGTTLGTAATGGTYFASPSISDGVVYVAALGAGIYAFSLPPNLKSNAVGREAPPLPASLHPDPRLRVTP